MRNDESNDDKMIAYLIDAQGEVILTEEGCARTAEKAAVVASARASEKSTSREARRHGR